MNMRTILFRYGFDARGTVRKMDVEAAIFSRFFNELTMGGGIIY